MKIHTNIEQNSVDWLLIRSGKVTASEMDALISPLGKIRTGDGVTTYLNQKLCERWMGGPLPAVVGVFDMEQGKLLEERAKPAFTLHTGIEIQSVGFIETDDGRAGCSPDAMIGDSSGVEIKCPRMDTHIGYLLSGELPKQYVAQVQGSMFVTGCKQWHFFSFHRAFPPLHIVVDRDEEFMQSLQTALIVFNRKMDEAMKRLEDLNGGPPKRTATSPVSAMTDRDDLIP